MAVLTLSQRYHELGWAIKRLMSAPNIQAESQADFATLVTQKAGYPLEQRTLSSYMRLVTVTDEETGREETKPRVRAPENFIAALLRLPITDEQRESVIAGWVAIQPPERRDALRQIFAAVNKASTSSEAWAEMLHYEADRAEHETQEDGERGSSGGREKAV